MPCLSAQRERAGSTAEAQAGQKQSAASRAVSCGIFTLYLGPLGHYKLI
ncbi:mCG1035980 [Mus musculus]|nr:mCG1035980 [Mus musculus]